MATRRLQIDLNYNAAPADAAAEEYNKRQKKRIAELLTDEQVAEKAKLEIIRKTNAAKIQEVVKAANVEKDTEKATATEIIASRGKVSFETINRIRQEEAARQHANDMMKKNAAMRHDIEMFQLHEQHEKTMAAWDAQQAKHQQLNSTILSGLKSVGSFGAAMLGLQSAHSIVSVFVDHFDKIRTFANRAAEDVHNMVGNLRSLAALEGNLGAPGAMLPGILEFRARTFQTQEASVEMLTAAKAAMFPMIQQGVMSQKDADTFLESQGQLQMMLGEDPRAIGRLAGNIPMMLGKPKVSAEEAEDLAYRIFLTQRLGGFEKYEQAASAMGHGMPYVGAGIYKPGEMAALTSAMAFGGNAARAEEFVEQGTMGVSAGLIRERHMKMSPENMKGMDKNELSSAAYFKHLGVTDQTRPMERWEAVAKDLMREEKEMTAKGKFFDPQVYLMKHGIIQAQTARAYEQMYSVMRQGDTWKNIKEAAMGDVPKGAIGEAFKKRIADDPFMAGQVAATSEEVTKMMVGEKVRDINTMKKAAFERLQRDGKISAKMTFAEFNDQGIFARATDTMFFGEHAAVDMETQNMVVQQARKAGLHVREPIAGGPGVAPHAEYMGDEEIEKLMIRTRRVGGNPLGSVAGDIADAAKSLRESADALKKNVAGHPVPIPMPAKPVPHVTRVN